MRVAIQAFRKVFLHIKYSPVGLKYRQIVKVAFSKKYLIYTNVAISMSLSCVGDVVEQHYEIFTGEISSWDRYRTLQMGLSGCGVGFFCHHWYMLLDKVIHGRTLDQVLKKLLLDQFISSPIMITLFFAFAALTEESPIDEFVEEMRTKFWRLYTAEWVVWPPAQIINFYLIPLRFRVLYDNTISLGYDIYNSKVKHDKPSKHRKENDESNKKEVKSSTSDV